MGNNKCILFFLWCCVAHEFVDAKGGMTEFLDAQFMNITTDIKLEAPDLDINPDDVDVVETKSQKEWYKEFYSYDQDEAKSYWEKLTQGYELVIGDPSKSKDEQEPFEHVFKAVKLKFDFDFFGQTIHDIIITSSGAILTGDKDAEIDLPNHIAPFLSSLPPSEYDEIVYTNDVDKFVIQWTKYVDGNDEHKLEFQAKIYPGGNIRFIYHNIQVEAKQAAKETGYPVIIGLQNGFVSKDKETSKDTVHNYPSFLIPLEKLYVAPYSVITFTPTPNRCHYQPKDYCTNHCIYCEETNVCVERIETFRSPSPCDKGSKCADQCTEEKALVCGTDGVVYQNECLLKHAACEKGIDIQKQNDGPCNGAEKVGDDGNDNKHSDAFDTTVDDDDEGDNSQEDDEILKDAEDPCPDGYVHKKGDIDGATVQGGINATLEECADQCTGNSECNSFEHKENVCNLNKESEPNGPEYQDFIFCKKEGVCKCDDELKPYCLNNQRLFNNKCLLDCTVETEMIEVESITQGQCPGNQENQEDNKCKKTCSEEEEDDVPVCGEDGVMYPNECYFDLAVCDNPSLRVLGDGKCHENKDEEEKDDQNDICGIVCNKIYYPVCGTDGKTYSNKCMLELASCEQKKSIDVADKVACEEKLMHTAEELAELALKKADILAQKYGKLNYHMGISRTFRLAITLGVGLAVVSTIALIVVLVRHQKTIRRATREMQFQRLAAMNTNQYADEPRGVEMDFVKGVKYDKLPIVP